MGLLKSPQETASGLLPRNQRSGSPLSQTAGV